MESQDVVQDMATDLTEKMYGGGGGFRTRVQKSSTDSSTYLALPFDLICRTRTCTLPTDESPEI